MCGKLCRGLVAAQVPVVTEFSVFKAPGEEKVGMVIYTGRAPAYKLILTQEMLHEGWGSGFSSNLQLLSPSPKSKVKTKRTWADTKIIRATNLNTWPPAHSTP